MDSNTKERLNAIKRSFRLVMNGPASQSMREKGVEYKINWGVPLTQLRQMANDYGKDMELAIALWKEDIRECKILATLIMPPEEMSEELADLWMEQTTSQEMAEMEAFNLYQHVEGAAAWAYRWIATGKDLYQIAGYDILGRLFMRGLEPDERGVNELLDQADAALREGSAGVRHAALNCLVRFAGLGDDYARIVHQAIHLDVF